MKRLSSALEEKKSIRKAAFKKGSFGIEKTDSETLNPKLSERFNKESSKKAEVRANELASALPDESASSQS